MRDFTAIFEARLKREAKARRLHPTLRWLLLTLAIAVPAFAAGAATHRALQPPPTVDILRRAGNEYYLPVSSRQLTVQLVPLRPSAAVEKQIARRSSPAQQSARDLVSAAGLQATCADLAGFYPLTYSAGQPLTLPDELFDAQRGQYRTSDTLNWLAKHRDPQAFRTVGVLYADIFDDGYNYLFGQARLGGAVCLVSSARMAMDIGKKPPRQRYSAIVAHELGHTLGLEHTPDRRSVMAYADSLEQHDTQGEEITAADWARLKEVHPITWEN